MATSNLAWMASITCWSPSDDTKVIAKPLVPKRPARLTGIIRKSLFVRSSNSPDAVKVRVSVGGSIVVDDDVHPLNIDPATEDISSHKNTLFESLERGVSIDTKQNCQASSFNM